MKKSIAIMALSSCMLMSCNSGDEQSNSATKPVEISENTKPTNQKNMEKKFTYKEGNVEEVITIQFTADGKEVISGVHETLGGETHPITFVDMEYGEDLDLFMGGATCPAWQGEVMIGIESDFSRLGWNDGKTKKSYLN